MEQHDQPDITYLIPRALARARRLANSEAEAEDIAQEALLLVWHQLQRGRPIEALDAYLMVTLRRVAAKAGRGARAAGNSGAEVDETPAPGLTAEDRETCREVLSAIQDLPEREAVLLSAQLQTGAGQAELAERFNLPPGTVASRLARARARLRRNCALGQDNIADQFTPPD
ncbi:sigma-70 family RNA polymerase sigma factor [Alphaproteobacteria bacterium KMM 3653]|uniref:Sigma-70 family RNA polymerase sigma factor n=1 Tax=Harenicola maris TaxID=2841044 RepID=A0AAP2CN04_9RHOB|nr:sigma-70 family RNA polymerase sigma factor [Harenicola maris]